MPRKKLLKCEFVTGKNLLRLLQFSIKEFLFGGHVLSLGASFSAWAYTSLMGVEPNFLSIFNLYFIVQPIFFLDRYLDFQIDKKSNLERSKHIAIYRKYSPLILRAQ